MLEHLQTILSNNNYVLVQYFVLEAKLQGKYYIFDVY